MEKVIANWLTEHPSISIIKASLLEDATAVEKTGTTVTGVRLTNGQAVHAKVNHTDHSVLSLTTLSFYANYYSILSMPHMKVISLLPPISPP